MSVEKMREEFEAWARDSEEFDDGEDPFDWICYVTPHGDYYSSSLELAWKSWQASRSALVIELPSAGSAPEAPEDAIDDSYLDAHHAKIQMRNACFMAIDAAGLKVSP